MNWLNVAHRRTQSWGPPQLCGALPSPSSSPMAHLESRCASRAQKGLGTSYRGWEQRLGPAPMGESTLEGKVVGRRISIRRRHTLLGLWAHPSRQHGRLQPQSHQRETVQIKGWPRTPLLCRVYHTTVLKLLAAGQRDAMHPQWQDDQRPLDV